MSTPLLRGRYFDERDTDGAPAVLIIDERLAQRFWPGKDPIGRRMYKPNSPDEVLKPGPNTRWMTIVGVVRNVELEDLAGRPGNSGAYYYPAAQLPPRGMAVAIKTAAADPAVVLQNVRAELKKIDPAMPLSNVRTMTEYASRSLMSRRAAMTLATAFAVVSLFLSAVGIYGVLAYVVTQRSKEIGIRIALGSSTRAIFQLVVREGLWLVATGLVLGLGGTVALRHVLQTQIFGLNALDPMVLVSVFIVLSAIAVVACSLPARRATKVDPVMVLSQQR
jgi:putative ABC transport system permease protein